VYNIFSVLDEKAPLLFSSPCEGGDLALQDVLVFRSLGALMKSLSRCTTRGVGWACVAAVRRVSFVCAAQIRFVSLDAFGREHSDVYLGLNVISDAEKALAVSLTWMSWPSVAGLGEAHSCSGLRAGWPENTMRFLLPLRGGR